MAGRFLLCVVFLSIAHLRYQVESVSQISAGTLNVYAHSEEECEEKLARLIAGMKEELAVLWAQVRAG